MTKSEILKLAEFSRERTIEQAKHEDSDGYFGFLTGAEWENQRFLPLITALAESCEALEEALHDIENKRGMCIFGSTETAEDPEVAFRQGSAYSYGETAETAAEALTAHKKRMEGLTKC